MFLILQDYKGQIQLENLSQIISNDDSVREKKELTSQAEIISYLAQRYDVAIVFRDTVVYSYATAYKAGQLVYLDGDDFDTAAVYAEGSINLYNGYVYLKNANDVDYVAGILPTDVNYFTELGAQYDLFYTIYPSNPYDPKVLYAVDDVVFWKDKEYTCLHEVRGVSPDTSYYWGTGVAYEVAAGTLPTNETFWKSGDNRNQQILTYMIDITLYHLHCAIAPRNVPEHRKERYDGNDPRQTGGAIGWLKRAARGEVTAGLPLIIPESGNRIRHGGQPKQNNHY
jgi:hypothetical protein